MICSVNCKKKIKFADNHEFVLKITTKDGKVNQLLDSEDFDHPSLCGQMKANSEDNSVEYVDGKDC